MENNKSEKNLEIEYKFLIDKETFFKYLDELSFDGDAIKFNYQRILQGYLSTDPLNTIRVRSVMDVAVTKKGNDYSETLISSSGFLTKKQKQITIGGVLGDGTLFNSPVVNIENEVKISYESAEESMANQCMVGTHSEPLLVSKIRFTVKAPDGNVWEVDEFLGNNSGLYVAELEVPNLQHKFEKPEWVLEDVSLDRRFANSALAMNPFKKWKHEVFFTGR